MRRDLLVILFALAIFSSTVFAEPEGGFEVVKSDELEGVIVPADKGSDFFCAWEAYGLKNPIEYYWAPAQQDVLRIEYRLATYLKYRKPEQDEELFKKLPQYKRQYVGIVTGGKKKIWINLFHNDFLRKTRNKNKWKNSPLCVDGGGAAFFSIIYDLKTEGFSDFSLNAEE